MHKIEVQFSQNLARFAVSLFTREWIEILMRTAKSSSTARLPLYGGVD